MSNFFGADFYPTPLSVAYKMREKISKDAKYILEPSAGSGNLASVFAGNKYDGSHARQVDCIESHPDLVAILRENGYNVVGHDWLSYEGVSFYDAIAMNPPYAQGAAHLLRAWDFLYSGEIVCLLNEETIKNPYTAERQRLLKIIEENNGTVDYLADCFSSAARKTDVKVAMVYLKKIAADDSAELWANKTETVTPDDSIGEDPNMLALRDQLGNMQHYYDMATVEMFKAFQHIRKAKIYLGANDIDFSQAYDQVLSLASGNMNNAKAAFVRLHSKSAWTNVIGKTQFHKWLDKKQADQMIRDIEKNSCAPFTKENIKGTLENIVLNRSKLFEQSVANVFDELTKYFNGNTNHTEGWKTNDSYKVNEKLVFPYGCRYEKNFGFNLWYSSGSQIDFYNDLDRVLCVLDKQDFDECLTIRSALELAFDSLKERRGGSLSATLYRDEALQGKARSQYFDIRFYKKGTVHLKFRHRKLWEQFNVKASAGKRWLGSNTKGNAA